MFLNKPAFNDLIKIVILKYYIQSLNRTVNKRSKLTSC